MIWRYSEGTSHLGLEELLERLLFHQLDPAIARAARVGAVVRNRFGVAHADGSQARGGDAVLHQPRYHRGSALLREGLVSLLRSRRIGVPFDLHLPIGLVVEQGGHLGQHRLRFRPKRGSSAWRIPVLLQPRVLGYNPSHTPEEAHGTGIEVGRHQ